MYSTMGFLSRPYTIEAAMNVEVVHPAGDSHPIPTAGALVR